MKKLVTALALLAATAITSTANADQIAAPLWACKLNAKVSDRSFSLIVGLINVHGKGTIRCTSALGQRVEKPVVLQIVGFSYGPDVALPTGKQAELDMLNAAVGLSSVEAMYGEYSVAFGLQAHVGTTKLDVKRDLLKLTPRLPHGGVSTGFSVTVTNGGQFGLGVNKNITGMTLMTPAQYAHKRQQDENRRMNQANNN